MFKNKQLAFSFVDNSILLTTKTIANNGFVEIWRQEDSKKHSIQILCYNESTFELKAFDRFKWSDEPLDIPLAGLEDVYKEDLWTPIILHFTIEWLKRVRFPR